MKQATDNRNRLFYDLVAIAEIFRYRLIWILNRLDVNDAIAYSYRNLDKKSWHERLMQWLMKRCSRSTHDDDDDGLDATTRCLLE